ncbi:MAG: hypothetical protein DMF72_07100 [Acidobacteria bacterium]|nr:MAG: hypothetical protein DMF72_07100 [Acidobacteriota bacterium]
MKTLKRLSLTAALTTVLAVSAFAGEIQTPPCAPPEPGETHSPPCATAQSAPDDSATPGQPETMASASDAVSLGDFAVDVLQSVLLLF